jgi:HK97 family phage major capsid protein
MNPKDLLKMKLSEQEALVNTAISANRGMAEEETVKFDTLETEIKNLEKTIEAQEKVSQRQQANAKPVNTPLFAEPKQNTGIKVFKNLAEQLQAVKKTAETGIVDERLQRLNNEYQSQVKNALGASEGVGTDGGFAVQTDIAGGMMDSAAKSGNILPLVDSYEVSDLSRGVEWVDIDEDNVGTTVFGGVQVYWASEGIGANATKPKLINKELKLEKLLGFAYATYELDRDSNFTSMLYNKAFTKAIQRTMEGAIIGGDGVGKPIGIINSGSKVTIAKENGQAAATILWENIAKMYNRTLTKDEMSKWAWLAHPDTAEQFDFLTFPIGVGGVPVYLGASSVGDVSTLKGRPIIETDHCSALGTEGDLIFTNLDDYFMIYKGGIDAQTSMHVAFLTAENCFRFIFSANGMPKRNKKLTIKNSSNQRSNIITLATR